MLKLKPLKTNMTELVIDDTTIMFSYQTPVAGFDDLGAFRTDTKYSVTTSRHINEYLGGKDIGRVVPQGLIEQAVALGCNPVEAQPGM